MVVDTFDVLAEESLDVDQVLALVVLTEGQGHARSPRARCSTDAMHIRLGDVR
jgi:hypothetical protein